jgi:phenylalanyl-tRNA synthetase beta chain
VLALGGDAAAVRFEAAIVACLASGTRRANISQRVAIGWLGELHPHLIKALNLTNTLFLFELEIESAFMSKALQFKAISKFP